MESSENKTAVGGDQAALVWDAPLKFIGAIKNGYHVRQFGHDVDMGGTFPALPTEIGKEVAALGKNGDEHLKFWGAATERVFLHGKNALDPHWFALFDIMPPLTFAGISLNQAVEESRGLLITADGGREEYLSTLRRVSDFYGFNVQVLLDRLTTGNWVGLGKFTNGDAVIASLKLGDLNYEKNKVWQEDKTKYSTDLIPNWLSSLQSNTLKDGEVVKGPVQQVLFGLMGNLRESLSDPKQLHAAERRFTELFGRRNAKHWMRKNGISGSSNLSDVVNAGQLHLMELLGLHELKDKVSFSRSTELFKASGDLSSNFTKFWANNYQQLARALNDGYERSNSSMMRLDTNISEAPLFMIDPKIGSKEKLSGIDRHVTRRGSREFKEPLAQTLERIQSMCDEETVISPSTVNLAYLLLTQKLVLPQDGSHYSEQGRELEAFMSCIAETSAEDLPLPELAKYGLAPKSILRVNPKALERIPAELELTLPTWAQRTLSLVGIELPSNGVVNGDFFRELFSTELKKLEKLTEAFERPQDILGNANLNAEALWPWLDEINRLAKKEIYKSPSEWLSSISSTREELKSLKATSNHYERLLRARSSTYEEVFTQLSKDESSTNKYLGGLGVNSDLPNVNQLLQNKEAFTKYFTKTSLDLSNDTWRDVQKVLLQTSFNDEKTEALRVGLLEYYKNGKLDSLNVHFAEKDLKQIVQLARTELFNNTEFLERLYDQLILPNFIETDFSNAMQSVLEKALAQLGDLQIGDIKSDSGEVLVRDKRFLNKKWNELDDQSKSNLLKGLFNSFKSSLEKGNDLNTGQFKYLLSQLNEIDRDNFLSMYGRFQSLETSASIQQKLKSLNEKVANLERDDLAKNVLPLAMMKRDVQITLEALNYSNHRPWFLQQYLMSPEWAKATLDQVETYEQHMKLENLNYTVAVVDGNKLVYYEDKANIFGQPGHPQQEEVLAHLQEVLKEHKADTISVMTFPDHTDTLGKMLVIEKDGSLSTFCGNASRFWGTLYQNWVLENGNNFVIENLNGDKILMKHEDNHLLIHLPVEQKLSRDLTKMEIGDDLSDELQAFGAELKGVYAAAGEPHLVIDLNGVKMDTEVLRELSLRLMNCFEDGVNIDFILDKNEKLVTVFERGVNDFTGSCGTGTLCMAESLGLNEDTLSFYNHIDPKNPNHIKFIRKGENTIALVNGLEKEVASSVKESIKLSK